MLPPKCMCLPRGWSSVVKYPWDLAIAESPQYPRSPREPARGHAPRKKTVWKTESTKFLLLLSYIWIFSDSQGSDHRVVGKEAGFGISVKNNSHRAYSGVNSTEKTLLGVPPLSWSQPKHPEERTCP